MPNNSPHHFQTNGEICDLDTNIGTIVSFLFVETYGNTTINVKYKQVIRVWGATRQNNDVCHPQRLCLQYVKLKLMITQGIFTDLHVLSYIQPSILPLNSSPGVFISEFYLLKSEHQTENCERSEFQIPYGVNSHPKISYFPRKYM